MAQKHVLIYVRLECMYLHLYTRAYTHIHALIYLHVYVYTHAYTHIHTHILGHGKRGRKCYCHMAQKHVLSFQHHMELFSTKTRRIIYLCIRYVCMYAWICTYLCAYTTVLASHGIILGRNEADYISVYQVCMHICMNMYIFLRVYGCSSFSWSYTYIHTYMHA